MIQDTQRDFGELNEQLRADIAALKCWLQQSWLDRRIFGLSWADLGNCLSGGLLWGLLVAGLIAAETSLNPTFRTSRM
jgi:hypothetical protein